MLDSGSVSDTVIPTDFVDAGIKGSGPAHYFRTTAEFWFSEPKVSYEGKNYLKVISVSRKRIKPVNFLGQAILSGTARADFWRDSAAQV